MSFFRHREIFRSDVIRLIGERPSSRSPAHRLDEFPVGYSSASCTPAALASASPTGIHSATLARRWQRSFQPMANSALTSCVTPGDNRSLALGLVASRALSRGLGSLLFGVTAGDPATFAGIALVLTAVSALAGYIPAWRASRIDPMTALRSN
jgi:hypothetical protein